VSDTFAVAGITAEPTIATDPPVAQERRTSPIELLWDLVFALAVLYGAGGTLPAWALAAVLTALMAALCVVESVTNRRGGLVRRSR